MKNMIWLALLSLFAFACGGPDLTNPDNYPVRVTHWTDEAGVEHTESVQLPFDYDQYGQAQEALVNAPPQNYGISSAQPPGASDTRCPSGGFTSGSNYCEMAGTKHINWDTVEIDHSRDAQYGIDMRNYIMLGLLTNAGDVSNTGFVSEKDNSSRTKTGVVNFGFCLNGAFACTTWDEGPVTLAGGQRVRLSTGGRFTVTFDTVNLVNPVITTTPNLTERATLMINLSSHEFGHAEGFGHVPSSVSTTDQMNLDNGTPARKVQKHLSSTEKSQLTTWVATF